MAESRWVTAMGAGILAVALVLFGVGVYTVYGIAKDPSGHLGGLKQQLNITSSGPNASFSWSSQGYNVTFTDTSTDNGSTITDWAWDFGDGTYYTGATPPPHVYASTCPRCTENVTLGVTDASGHQSVATAQVTVQKFVSANGVGRSPASPVQVPGGLGNLSESVGALELLALMFLIGGSVARAGWRLLRREPAAVQVPVAAAAARS